MPVPQRIHVPSLVNLLQTLNPWSFPLNLNAWLTYTAEICSCLHLQQAMSCFCM